MLSFLARRLLSTVLVMAIVGIFIFMLLHLLPGDPAAIIAEDNATQEQITAIRQRLGLDDPLAYQFLRWAALSWAATSASRSSRMCP
jgi:peptide/nickel transport system permease protein